jgi:hypothetical protein
MGRTGLQTDEPEVRTFDQLTRHLTVIAAASIVTGLVVGGLGSRLFMRFAALAAEGSAQGRLTEAEATVGRITFPGTMSIVLFVGIFSGIVGAVLYAIFRPWLGWAGGFRGLAFGVVLFAVASATSDVMNPDNFDFSLLGRSGVIVAMIVVLFLAFGVAMDGLFGWFDRRFPTVDDGDRRFRKAYVFVSALGAFLSLLAMPQFLFSSSSCDCDPPIAASIFVVVTGIGTLTLWAAWLGGGDRRTWSVARALGFTGLVGTCLFGLWRAASDAVEIITAT